MSAASSSWRFAAWYRSRRRISHRRASTAGDVVVVDEEVRPAQLGVAEPERPRDAADE
jgi:hypothetical protein